MRRLLLVAVACAALGQGGCVKALPGLAKLVGGGGKAAQTAPKVIVKTESRVTRVGSVVKKAGDKALDVVPDLMPDRNDKRR